MDASENAVYPTLPLPLRKNRTFRKCVFCQTSSQYDCEGKSLKGDLPEAAQRLLSSCKNIITHQAKIADGRNYRSEIYASRYVVPIEETRRLTRNSSITKRRN